MVAVEKDRIAYGSKKDVVMLHLDTMGFEEKPKTEYKNNNIPGIISRTARNIVQITKEEMVERILNGYSFIPGVCPMSDDAKKKYGGGSKQEDWQEQQIFALDFDSAIDKGMMESHMDEILEALKKLGIAPLFAYSSFADGKFVVDRNVEKFRVVFSTDKVVSDIELRDKLQATLMGLFSEQIDRQCSNRNRYYNGTKPNARTYLEYNAVIDAEWIVNTYWDDKYVEHTPSDSSLRKKSSNGKKAEENITGNNGKNCSRKSTNKTYEIEDRGTIVPFTRANKKNIKHDLSLMGKIFELRSWKEEERRERFVFIYYFDAVLLYGFEKALEMVGEFHEKMEEQLTDREFYYAITRANECIDRFIEEDSLYPYSREKISSELYLTNDEIKECGIFRTKEKNERADKLRPIKDERDEFIIGLSKNGELKLWEIKEQANKYYPEVALKSEKQISRIIADAKKEDIFPQTTNNLSIHYDIEENLKSDEPTLNEEQQLAFDDILRGNNIVLTGYAGTGKSYLIEKIREELKSRGQTVAVCAATGVAAYNIGGSTLHRLFHIYGDEEWERTITNSFLSEIAEHQTIIVDEAGMVKAKDFQHMCGVVTKVKRKLHKNIQLVLVCDVLQLPPVNDAFFFQTNCYQQLNFKHHYLTQSIRQQEDEEYAYYLNKVRIGEDKELASCELNRICSRRIDNRYIYIVPYKVDAESINRSYLNTLNGEMIDLGNNQYVKIGAKIIVTENYARNGIVKYFNGMQGKVIAVSDNRNVLTIFTTDGRNVKIHRRSVQVKGQWVQGFPIDLGYAITTHKSQGMTLEGANINPCSFAEGQLYVALSRVKSARGVHLLKPIKPEYIMVNGDALAFDEIMRLESEVCIRYGKLMI